ncbi:MAG: metal ABC transporter permease [Parcubacteria group bacterium]|nr:metal ABC transporter permease [Parcubacteria group bacterium]
MLEIFQYDFMIRAFIAGTVIAILAPTIGIFLVAKRYSLLADTLAHVSLVGIVLGVLFGFNPLFGALATSVAAAFGMEKLRESKKMFSESILALFLSGSLALALVILGASHSINVNIFSYLFGSISTVSPENLFVIVVFGSFVILSTLLLFKKFFVVAYDEDLAKANGLPVALLNTLMIILAAITVSLGMQVVGTLLVGALMVIPVMTASQFKKGFSQTAFLSVIFSLISVIGGLFASFYLNIPSGGTIVLTALFFFGLSLFWNRNV